MTERHPDKPQTDAQTILQQIQDKISHITDEFSAGTINAVQFNAMYRHYTEKRQIVEKLLERNPGGDAWRAAASPGKTIHLRDRFQARTLYYVVFRRGEQRPLRSEGKLPKKAAEQVLKLLQILWKMQRWRQGLARKSLGDGQWLLLMVGGYSLTIAVYFLQPSAQQVNHMRDLHADFERANRKLLERGLPAKRMVFPQRALMEKQS